MATTIAPDTHVCFDQAIGPGSCIREFDFTLTFEQSILSILPSALLLLATPLRLFQLSKTEPKVTSHRRWIKKAAAAAVNSALQLVLVVLWSSSPHRTQSSVPAAALSLVYSLFMMCLSYFEDQKSTRPSTLMLVYLLISILFDAAQARTLWIAKAILIAAIQSASIGARTIMLFLEARSKTSYLRQPYQEYPPESRSGILSLSFVWWLNSLFATGFKTLMTTGDLFSLDPSLKSDRLGQQLRRIWDKSAESDSRYALPKDVFRLLKMDLLMATIPRLCIIGFRFAQPFLIASVIRCVEATDTSGNQDKAYGLIAATFLVYLGLAISTVHVKQIFSRITMIFRGSMISLLYTQTLTFEEGVCKDSASLTLMSTDVDNIIEHSESILEVWALPVEISIGTWLLQRQLGAICIVPLVLVCVCTAGQTLVAKSIGKDQQAWNEQIQERVKDTSGMLGAMKEIKMMGLVSIMRSSVQNKRKNELKMSRPFFTGIMWLNTIANIPAIWSAVISFIIFAIRTKITGGASLTIVKAFASMSIIALVTSPAAKLLALLPQLAAARGSFQRLQDYLGTKTKKSVTQASVSVEDLQGPHMNLSQMADVPLGSDIAVKFENATILPARKSTMPVISGANFSILKGSITMIIGSVGSGKTTLTKAILGEVPVQSGRVMVAGKDISYCDQSSWITNSTIRHSICGPFHPTTSHPKEDNRWYNKTIFACALDEDIQSWPEGDSTIVGSKGITLSGGQRQRVALARAIYARKSTVLLDDVLSALDNKTQKKVTQRLLSKDGVLRQIGSTVILTTHSVRYLHFADQILAIDSQGFVAFQDPPTNQLSPEPLEEQKVGTDESSNPTSTERSDPDDKLMDSTRRIGDLSIYSYYFKRAPLRSWLLFFASVAAAVFAENFPQVWLNWWAMADGQQLSKYLPVYTALAVGATIFGSIYIWIMFLDVMPQAAIRLHQILLDAVMHAPLSFFASTDTGVTLNRFAQDMSIVDLALPIAASHLVIASLTCVAKLALISTGSSYMALTIPFTMAAIFGIQHIYLRTSRQLRYLDLENKSPLYSHFVQTLEGLTTIRAFGWEQAATETQHCYLDFSQRPYYMLLCAQRWLGLVLDLIVTALATIVVALALTLRSTNAGLVGLALTNILGFNQSLSLVVTSWTSLETSLGAIARVKSFTESVSPREDEVINRDGELSSNWPETGAVFINSVSTKYRDILALRDISIEIMPGQKIGVCGRTGSGKSSLILSLLGLAEISTGTIVIDGVDITTLRSQTICERLVTLPQDPVLLPGSVRFNADPFGRVCDTAIVSAMAKVGIWQALESRGGLDAIMADHPLSQGEQQLFSLARALLRKSKILILDEATSSVDGDTNLVMQKIISEEFKDCTIINVAHRLETIISMDKIAVLDGGRLVEFDTPQNLLSRDSTFKQMHQS